MATKYKYIKFPINFWKLVREMNPKDFHLWFITLLIEANKEEFSLDTDYNIYEDGLYIEGFEEAITLYITRE